MESDLFYLILKLLQNNNNSNSKFMKRLIDVLNRIKNPESDFKIFMYENLVYNNISFE